MDSHPKASVSQQHSHFRIAAIERPVFFVTVEHGRLVLKKFVSLGAAGAFLIANGGLDRSAL